MASISTLQTTLLDALDYEESGSVSKAHTVVTTCRKLLAIRPSSSAHSASSMQYDPEQLRQLMLGAQAYIRSNRTGGGVRFLGISRDWTR